MKQCTLFFLIFFAIAFPAAGQSSVLHLKVDDHDLCEGIFTVRIPLHTFSFPQVKVLSSSFSEEGQLPSGVEATDEPSVSMVLGKEKTRPFALLRIPAYSIASAGEGFRRLTSVTLEVNENSQPNIPLPAKTTTVNSKLASGNWYKIAVDHKGVYKIDYDFIKNNLGVDVSTIDTRNIRVYGNDGVILPESNSPDMPDDLVENAVAVFDGGDNKLNQGDYVLFYANGPTGWVYDTTANTYYHQNNIYEDRSYYFLNFDLGPGLRINTIQSSQNANINSYSFDDHQLYEKDLTNVGKFGKRWFGEELGTNPGQEPSRTFSFDVPGTDSANVRIMVGSKSLSTAGTFSVRMNGIAQGNVQLPPNGNGNDWVLSPGALSFNARVQADRADIQLDYVSAAGSATGYLDYIELIARRSIILKNGFLSFRDSRSVGSGAVTMFHVQNANSNTVVWEVTNGLQPIAIAGSLNGANYTFARPSSTLREYIAFDGSAYSAPLFVEKVVNQNLHGLPQTDFVIITHPDFLEAAEKLANFHREHDGMRVVVATTPQVYNEFSSGSQDIAAIRNFMRMFYKRAGGDSTQMPRHLLLLGDASYDYKNRVQRNTNYVPTWETAESITVTNGYCSDDFFSFLDDNEDINNLNIPNTMDISVGRLPVNTKDGANRIVDKIINYTSPASLGAWRLSTTLMADDGDNNVHFMDAEMMAATINQHSNLYNETKVYVSALPLVATPGGVRCPDANKAINDQVYKGTFLMNYNGHGSPTTLTAERILTQDDFNTWKNGDKLPIMVTATCTFSKFDDPSLASAGELLMTKPDGGAIALLTTTQLVYQGQNQTMNVDFLNAFFRKYAGEWPSFGDAFRYGKNKSYITAGNKDNFRKFVLLGDPALMPAFPRYSVTTDSILDAATNLPVDTMKALGFYRITGAVKGTSGQVLNDFNGRVDVTIYDKPKVLGTLTGDYKSFQVQNNIIYKGKATVEDGKFSLTFITPKDINYNFGKGKISYYAENGNTDAAGTDTSLTIGGYSDGNIVDNEPPLVKPFINDSLFRDGGITGSSTLLYVQLFDKTGINVTGNSVGHDLTAVLDENVGNPYILNDYYETAPNDYQRGYVNFPLSGLSEGRHTIRVKAWDMLNNSGEGTVRFQVVNGRVMEIQNLMNYPNPFADETHFVFDHNHPGEELTVRIRIYSTSGYLVRTLEENFVPGGSRSNEITWDATDNNGAKLPSGVYVYRISLSTEKGIQSTAYQKLVIIR